MNYQITEVQFDFDDLDSETQDEIYDNVLFSFWEVDDEDDLAEEITCVIGYCVKSLNYVHVLR
jgi:hypothetical protein